MDEQTIAQQVARNIPQEPVTVSEPVVEQAPDPQPFHWNGEIENSTFLHLADVLGLDRITRHHEATQNQLRSIYRYAVETLQTTDMELILGKISEMETGLGIAYKPDRMQRLARWVDLEKRTQILRRQQEFINHG